MVRLKDKGNTNNITTLLLQFLYGAIKSCGAEGEKGKRKIFQFLYGAIKSSRPVNIARAIEAFQFLYGAIKSG